MACGISAATAIVHPMIESKTGGFNIVGRSSTLPHHAKY
jgi:hypothetical protein